MIGTKSPQVIVPLIQGMFSSLCRPEVIYEPEFQQKLLSVFTSDFKNVLNSKNLCDYLLKLLMKFKNGDQVQKVTETLIDHIISITKKQKSQQSSFLL